MSAFCYPLIRPLTLPRMFPCPRVTPKLNTVFRVHLMCVGGVIRLEIIHLTPKLCTHSGCVASFPVSSVRIGWEPPLWARDEKRLETLGAKSFNHCSGGLMIRSSMAFVLHMPAISTWFGNLLEMQKHPRFPDQKLHFNKLRSCFMCALIFQKPCFRENDKLTGQLFSMHCH